MLARKRRTALTLVFSFIPSVSLRLSSHIIHVPLLQQSFDPSRGDRLLRGISPSPVASSEVREMGFFAFTRIDKGLTTKAESAVHACILAILQSPPLASLYPSLETSVTASCKYDHSVEHHSTCL
jgi:hypothetical protein